MIYSYQNEEILSTNQLLVLSGTLHSVMCMINSLKEEKERSLYFKYKKKVISYFLTMTNLSFIFISENKEAELYKKIFKEFCDYVMLDPFYILDMPINSKKFDPSKYFKNNK